MNETAAVTAIQTLVSTNKATLVTGLTGQGVARTIMDVRRNLMSPPRGYYWIGIDCPNVRSIPFEAQNIARPDEQVLYSIIMDISDLAIVQPSEGDPFNTYRDAFRLLTDRIVKLLWDTTWYPNASSSPRFRLHHRTAADGSDETIIKRNLGSTWQEAEAFHAQMYTRLEFSIFEHSADTSLLYP